MRLKFVDVRVDPGGQLLVIALVDGHVVHIAPRQVLGQDLEKYVILIFHDRLMDAAFGKGAGRNNLPLIQLGQRGHPFLGGAAKEQALHLVVILEAVLAPCGVQDPVSNVRHIQQAAELLSGKLQFHDTRPPFASIIPAELGLSMDIVSRSGA